MSTPKEPHFFTYMAGNTPIGGHSNPFYKPQRRITDLAEYQSLFRDVSGATAVGEASPPDLYGPDVPERIADLIPNARLIAILRNPADRAFSNFQMNRRLGQEPLETFEQALAAEDQRVSDNWGYAWHYYRKGLYAEQIARYREHFGVDQLLVVLHDDLVNDAGGLLRQIHGFLGVNEEFEPNLEITSNVSGVPRNRALGVVLRPALMLHRYWVPIVPRTLRYRLRGKLLTKARMAPATRESLVNRYRSSIEDLQERRSTATSAVGCAEPRLDEAGEHRFHRVQEPENMADRASALKPTFLIIGAQKLEPRRSTIILTSIPASSRMSPVKEPNYFAFAGQQVQLPRTRWKTRVAQLVQCHRHG